MGLKLRVGGHVKVPELGSFAVVNGDRFGLVFVKSVRGVDYFAESTGLDSLPTENTTVKISDTEVVLNEYAGVLSETAAILLLVEYSRLLDVLGVDREVTLRSIWDE